MAGVVVSFIVSKLVQENTKIVTKLFGKPVNLCIKIKVRYRVYSFRFSVGCSSALYEDSEMCERVREKKRMRDLLKIIKSYTSNGKRCTLGRRT